MQYHPAIHPHLYPASALALCFLALATPRASVEEVEASDPDEAGTPGFLEIMWNGSPEERLELAWDLDEEIGDALAQTDDPEALVAALETALDAEPDPWIRYSFLLGLAHWSEDRILDRVFMHALDSGTRADQWPALVWMSENAVPDALPLLEELWPARGRPLLRPLLVKALVRGGSVSHTHEFMDLALGRDPEEAELALVAVTALGMLGDETAIPLLLRLSRDRSVVLATAAVTALGEIGHESVVPSLARLSRGKGAVAEAAVWSLARYQQPESLQARLRLVNDGGAPDDIRQAAMETLGPEDDPGIFPALRAVITGTRSPGDSLVRAAWRALRLNAALDGSGEAMRFLESREDGKIVYFTTFCGGTRVVSAAGDTGPPQLRVTPTTGHSLRCWAGPGLTLEFDDELAARIPSGWPVRIGDLYEGPDEVLVNPYYDGEFEDCWVSLDQLQWRELTAAEDEQEYFNYFWLSPTAGEFDIPLHESFSETALLLQEAALIEFFDPGPESIGATLVLDGIGSERRDLLLLLSEAGDAPLLQEALEWAWDHLTEEDDTEH